MEGGADNAMIVAIISTATEHRYAAMLEDWTNSASMNEDFVKRCCSGDDVHVLSC